ncbi:hypothetical protein [Aquabacterium sp.]|uniref:beta strand repeat-containing protein n=1 Tax=Aquabacterium sp. TaxID=1872578 RepID=UPI0026277641|nr:hypothetical protein [Aquabacterium sp.]MDD2978293.1 hypothetical protein [Aquabacterium sp.]
MLTKGLDNFLGQAGNDTIIGSIVATATSDLNTLSPLDIVNGGAGTDTLKVSTDGTAVVLPNMTAVEIVEIESTGAVSGNFSANADVTNLNVTKAAGVVAVTASATADVSVAIKESNVGAAAVDNTIQGGKNVTVNMTNAGDATPGTNADKITLGATTAAKGDVVVNVTGKAYDAADGAIGFGAIAVTGGKTVSVTQKASSDASKAAADTTAGTVSQGAVTVNANADTTDITIKQDATVAAVNAAPSTGGVTETATIKFGALKTNDTLAVNGLTFKALENLTGEQVAAAFSNMVSGLAVAGKDTQGSQVASKGVFTGAFDTTGAAGYTAAAASGDTVVFTAARANQDATDLTTTGGAPTITLTNTSGNSVAPTVTVVQGKAHDATPAGGVMGVAAGAVTIAGAAATAVKTVTVDGYAATTSAGLTATTSALETLNLSNGGDFVVTQAAATLAMNLTNVGTAAKAATPTSAAVTAAYAVLDLNNTATKTLNIKSNGTNTVKLDLAGATGTTTLNVSGTGLLNAGGSAAAASTLGNVTTIKVTETAGLNLSNATVTNVTSVDTTGTTGATTIAIDGGKATYAGGAGVDTVTVSAATGGFTKAIDLGAGNDTLNLEALSVAQLQALPVTNVLKGGEGDDTIALTAAQAVDLSANSTFAGKIEGFEKLSLTNATATGTVNLANLDNINYVVSKGSASVAAAATPATFTVDFTGSTLLVGTEDSISFNGATLAPTTSITTASALVLALGGLSYTNWNVKSVAGNTITFEAKVAGTGTVVPAAPVFTVTDAGGTASVIAQSISSSTAGVAAGAAAAALTIDNLASGGTLELTGESAGAIVKVKDAATSTADVLNVVTKVLDTGAGAGTVTAENVETINLKVNNADSGLTDAGYKSADGVNNVFTPKVSTTTITLKGNDSLKAVTVDGAGHVVLTDSAANTKLATIDANALTGNLTLDLSAHNGVAVTVTGGKGNDVLTASQGVNSKADVLVGGEGNDTLNAGSNGAKLTGGAGNDLFVLTAGTKEVNTYTSIQDFQAGDVLELNVIGAGNVTAFNKLTAVLNENTSVFSNFVDAAIQQATAGQSVWFQFKGNAYVVVDNVETGGASADVFQNGQDAVIELVGIDLNNASFNSTHATVALI